jgi:hypothetical protein
VRTHPALDADQLAVFRAFQHINYLCSIHTRPFLNDPLLLLSGNASHRASGSSW